MNQTTNPQIELAYEYVCFTNKNIFLTGKAGTGKTTFLKRIREEVQKRVAVAAPTGVAAINAGGVTIHSLFQLPFGTLVPDRLQEQLAGRRFSKQKIDLIRSLDLLIIDEISMVRADVLDAVDQVLRRYRNYAQPFGGLQLLMIGDLHQLPPVVKQDEWELMSRHYPTPYFFGSKALQETDAITIELKHIYRQSDQHFIHILNKVRGNKLDEETMDLLNTRFQADFAPQEEEGYITLSSHNHTAQQINIEKLNSIPGKIHRFEAEIEGDFPTHAYPTEVELEFKLDAQVMFMKNDLQPERRYYNGKIGRITRIGTDFILVQCPDDPEPIEVTIAEWTNVKYQLDPETKEVREEVIGIFRQYPLKLAWAITIHKSQGLTFERVIIDAAAAFAHGQVYVALSRCKSFEGIVLRTKLQLSSVKTDTVVKEFTEEAEQNQPTPEQLQQAKREFQQGLLLELFSCQSIERYYQQLERILLENESAFQGEPLPKIRAIKEKLDKQIIAVAHKFIPHLKTYFSNPALPEENVDLLDRLQKASAYFCKHIQAELLPELQQFTFLSDNKKEKTRAEDKLQDIQRILFIKNACFECCGEQFNSRRFIEVRTNAELDFEEQKKRSPRRFILPSEIPNPELYRQLSQWRADTAAKEEVEHFQILPNRSLYEMVQVLPTSQKALKQINGIGKQRLQKYGEDLIGIISEYAIANGLSTDQLQLADSTPEKEVKPPKVNTKAISYGLYRDGLTIEEIAEERSLVTSTIESHLAYYIKTGELDIHEVVPKEKVETISAAYQNNDFNGLGELKAHLGDDYSYGELRMVRDYLDRVGEVKDQA